MMDYPCGKFGDYNIVICKAHKVSSNIESEVKVVSAILVLLCGQTEMEERFTLYSHWRE